MPEPRKREQAIGVKLTAIESQLADRAEYLRLAETITSFLARLRTTAKTLDVSERQRPSPRERNQTAGRSRRSGTTSSGGDRSGDAARKIVRPGIA
jgi:hypothetical protein